MMSYSAFVAGFYHFDTEDALPPLGPRIGVLDHIPDPFDRGGDDGLDSNLHGDGSFGKGPFRVCGEDGLRLAQTGWRR